MGGFLSYLTVVLLTCWSVISGLCWCNICMYGVSQQFISLFNVEFLCPEFLYRYVLRPSVMMEIYRRKDSSRLPQQCLYIVKFYCNMFRLTYKEPSSGSQSSKENVSREVLFNILPYPSIQTIYQYFCHVSFLSCVHFVNISDV